MPVSLSMHVSPRRESAPIPLISNTTEAWTANNKVNIIIVTIETLIHPIIMLSTYFPT